MNRINQVFETKSGNILSIYFTAGYPAKEDTAEIIHTLVDAGVDMIEIGMPFSDPIADGPVIQQSSDRALKNGMSLKLLFNQLKDIRKEVNIPLLLMGYLNPVLQFGLEKFCMQCAAIGIDGVILPDLPLEVYLGEAKNIINNCNLHNIFLISPQTSADRIKKIDSASHGFIYLLSSSATTGIKGNFSQEQILYFERISAMKLTNPTLIGFGISDHASFTTACKYAQGAIIGSAFVKMLAQTTNMMNDIRRFISEIKR